MAATRQRHEHVEGLLLAPPGTQTGCDSKGHKHLVITSDKERECSGCGASVTDTTTTTTTTTTITTTILLLLLYSYIS